MGDFHNDCQAYLYRLGLRLSEADNTSRQRRKFERRTGAAFNAVKAYGMVQAIAEFTLNRTN